MLKNLNNSKTLQLFKSSCYFSSTPNPKAQFLNSVSSLILYDFDYTLEVHFEKKKFTLRSEKDILFLQIDQVNIWVRK